MPGRIEPTPTQLLQAWQLLRRQRRRPPWPADFDATMADPLLAALVRMQAVLRVMAMQRLRPQPARLSVPASAPPAHARRTKAVRFDPKKAAANDRDD